MDHRLQRIAVLFDRLEPLAAHRLGIADDADIGAAEALFPESTHLSVHVGLRVHSLTHLIATISLATVPADPCITGPTGASHPHIFVLSAK